MKKVVLLSLAAFSMALGIEFTAVITAQSGTASAVGTLGVQPGASNGLGMEDVVYIGFPPYFALYFENPTLPPPTLQFTTDIRSDSDSLQIWDGYIANPSSPFIDLSWTAPLLSPDSGVLFIGYCAVGGTPDSMFDMTTTTSLNIPTGNMLKIVFKQPVTEPINDTFPPFVVWWSPADGDTIDSPTYPLQVLVADSGEAGIDTSSVNMTLNGIDISWFLDKTITPDGLLISYTPTVILHTPGQNLATLSIADNAGNLLIDTMKFIFAMPDTGDTTPDTTGFVISGMVFLSGGISLSGSKVKIIEVAYEETTDFTGRFEFPPLPTDTYTVLATRVGYIPQQAIIYLTRDTSLFFMLESGGGTGVTVRGYVLLQGQSNHQGTNVTGMAVTGSETVSTSTNSTGLFTLSFTAPGAFKILATRAGYYPDSVFVFAITDTTIQTMTLVPMGYVLEENTIDGYISLIPAINGVFINSKGISSIAIFDIFGRLVQEWREVNPSIFWDGTSMGKKLPSGTYFVVGKGNHVIHKTLFIIK